MKLHAAVASILVAAARCSPNGEPPRMPIEACSAERRPGIAVTLQTRERLRRPSTVTVVIRRGSATVDSASRTLPSAAPTSAVAGAYEQAGRYSVVILSDAFEPWVRDGIDVSRDRCHVHTVRLSALLTPR